MNTSPSNSGAQLETCMLLKLSTELLQVIGRHCFESQDGSLLKLRAASRDLEYRTRNFWRHAYFSSRVVTLEHAKLKALCDVASRSDLANEVTGIVVRCADDAKVNLARNGKGAPFQVRNDLLHRAFRNLRNIKSVRFTDMNGEVLQSTNRKTDDGEALLVDFSATFATVIRVAEACDLQLTTISSGSSNGADAPLFGIVSPCGLNPCRRVLAPKCLSRITDLELCLLYEPATTGYAYNPLIIADELRAGMLHFKSLQRLRLYFSGYDNASRILVRSAVFLPCLVDLELSGLVCEMPSLCAFLRPHAGILQSFTLSEPLFLDLNLQIELFRRVLEELRDAFHLTALHLSGIETVDYSLSFSEWFTVGAEGDVNEDGWIDVWMNRAAAVLQGDDLKEDISNILSCLVWTQSP